MVVGITNKATYNWYCLGRGGLRMSRAGTSKDYGQAIVGLLYECLHEVFVFFSLGLMIVASNEFPTACSLFRNWSCCFVCSSSSLCAYNKTASPEKGIFRYVFTAQIAPSRCKRGATGHDCTCTVSASEDIHFSLANRDVHFKWYILLYLDKNNRILLLLGI